MKHEEAKKMGATHYTPNGEMYVRVADDGFVEVWRIGGNKWVWIPLTLNDCFVKPL